MFLDEPPGHCQALDSRLKYLTMLKRFGVAIEAGLLLRFDRLIHKRRSANRSEAIRDLIRDALVQQEWVTGDGEAAAAVVLVYNHHQRQLQGRMTELQHQDHERIISTMHAHLDHDNCMEVVLLRGKPADLRRIGERLIAIRGVKHGRVVSTTLGAELS
jgi:CopG family nickel-responsive transcriptional regulator